MTFLPVVSIPRDGQRPERFVVFYSLLPLAFVPMSGIPFMGQDLDLSDDRLGLLAISARRDHLTHIYLSTTPLCPSLHGIKTRYFDNYV